MVIRTQNIQLERNFELKGVFAVATGIGSLKHIVVSVVVQVAPSAQESQIVKTVMIDVLIQVGQLALHLYPQSVTQYPLPVLRSALFAAVPGSPLDEAADQRMLGVVFREVNGHGLQRLRSSTR